MPRQRLVLISAFGIAPCVRLALLTDLLRLTAAAARNWLKLRANYGFIGAL